MRTTISVLLGCFLLLFTSCKDYLDVKPKGKIIPETAEDYSTIIHYWLNQIEKGTDDVIIPNPDKVKTLEMYAEDLDATLASSTSSYTPAYVGVDINKNPSDYTALYSVIKDCNMIIGNMDDKTSDLAKKLLGTAWGIRSICYYNLMVRFCDAYSAAAAQTTMGLPLVDEFDMEAKPARSDLQATTDFIEKGFKTALSYNVTDKDYIITADVVKAYMARFYLWTQQWQLAIDYATPLLETYPMLDASQYADVINQKFVKGQDVIVAAYTEDDDIGTSNYVSAQADIKTRPVSGNTAKLFASSANDVRTAVAFNSKRTVAKVVTSKFRSEELCLIIAECYAHLNQVDDALTYLNKLREKRITKDFVAYTKDNLPEVYQQHITVDATGQPLSKLMSAILCEKRMELFAEGNRWFELKRNGSPEFWVAANGKKYTTAKYLYTFALPKNDIDLFPGLVVQNPGYIE